MTTQISGDIQQKIYDHAFEDEIQINNSGFNVREMKIIEAINHSIIELNKDNIKLLDVGCGAGNISMIFKKKCELFGIEVSKRLADIATNNGIKISLLNVENETYPFDNEYFDIVFSGEVIEHLVDPSNYLFENNRVLKKGGYFILSFPNINQPFSWATMILFDYPPVFSSRYKSPHFKDYTLKLIKNILNRYGFKILNIRGSYIRPFRNILSQHLANLAPRFSDQIIIISQKKTNADRDDRLVVWDTRDI